MQLQMTPMIDVVFQLLIFFVCTASFQTPEQALPTLLSVAGGSSAVETPVDPELLELEDVVIKLVRVSGGTRWRVNEQLYERLAPLRDLLIALAKQRRDLPVILDVEAQVPLGDVIDIYDLCRIIGFDRIQFAAKGKK
jgi:biopolymer transport protein ExbD